MDSYSRCEEKLKIAAAQNAKLETCVANGHLWCAIGDDADKDPDLVGPIRYNVTSGMKMYKTAIEPRLSTESIDAVSKLMASSSDIVVFVHGEHQRVTIFEDGNA